MTKKQTKPVASTRKKPAEPAPAGAEIAGTMTTDASKAVAAPAGKATSESVVVKRADKATIRRALDDLGINRPYYTARVVGGRLELALYGGDVVYWPPEKGA